MKGVLRSCDKSQKPKFVVSVLVSIFQSFISKLRSLHRSQPSGTLASVDAIRIAKFLSCVRNSSMCSLRNDELSETLSEVSDTLSPPAIITISCSDSDACSVSAFIHESSFTTKLSF
uniref:Uncharacterized protein n=1 Tax=Parascaris equorum TaxID=6256 RepID=A0A914RN42_PAREQ